MTQLPASLFIPLSAQSTELALLSGGDARLTLDSTTNVNKYGCGSHPDPNLLAFGSSTGSTISERGYHASQTLHHYLIQQQAHQPASKARLYRQQLERIRLELNHLCGIAPADNIASIFAASGTDLHLICAQLTSNSSEKPLRIIMMDGCETGSGVAPAVCGQHFSDQATLGGKVTAFEPIEAAHAVEVSSIKLRSDDGSKRALNDIDIDVDALIQQALANKQRVLLIMIDVSKTGLIAPSPAYIAHLRTRYPDQVDVLIDACQFRIAPATINAYLKLGCMLALTGSKFLTGPVFSGVLLIPPNLSARLSNQTLPSAMAAYSAQAEWPQHWQACRQLNDLCNWGLLLRLEAALAELKAFRALSEAQINHFVQQFADAMQHALQASPHFLLMAESRLDRSPIVTMPSWDQLPTIFPFILQHANGQPLSREQTQRIYKQLQFPIEAHAGLASHIANLRCQLGQPVLCGQQHGIDVSALRMCASSRVIIEACEHGEASAQAVIQRALLALEKTAYLIRQEL